jgi:endonuclease/exonuclease/phosphatase family metal-dependent hydrolase
MVCVALATACVPSPSELLEDGAGADLRPNDPSTDTGDNGRSPRKIGVATWNVQRYFDTRCDTGQCGRGDYEALPTPEEFQRRGGEIAAAIRALESDVICLQEIENQASFDEIVATLGADFPVAIFGETGAAASVDVAVVARGRLKRVSTHRQTPLERPDGSATIFARELLEVEVDLEGRRVIILCAHFKSKSGDDAGRRVAEAIGAHQIALDTAAEHPNALVILGGDLNDTPGSEAIDALVAEGHLLRVAEDLGGDDWTYVYDNTRLALDHLMMVRGTGEYLPGTAHVLRGSNGSYQGSDHGALRAQFD